MALAGLIIANVHVSRDYYAGQKETQVLSHHFAVLTQSHTNRCSLASVEAGQRCAGGFKVRAFRNYPGDGPCFRRELDLRSVWTSCRRAELDRSCPRSPVIDLQGRVVDVEALVEHLF